MGRLSEFLRVAAVAIALSLVLTGCGLVLGFSSVDVELVADWDAGTFTVAGEIDECTDGKHTEKEIGSSDAAAVRYYEFVCSDGTGSFVLRAEFEPLTEAQEHETLGVEPFGGTWTVSEGTGNYTDLEGSGTVHVEVDTAAVATYSGEMSN